MAEVSVIVPVYNVEKYLRKCIDSILAQTFKDFELILIDDKSPDNSGTICDEYAAKDSRIKVIHKEQNEGVSAARNDGLAAATGKYIMFCDSDDYVSDEWISKLHSLIVREDVDFGICGYNKVNAVTYDVISERTYSDNSIETLPLSGFWNVYKKLMFQSLWNKIYKREILLANCLKFKVSLSRAEDVTFNLQYLRVCENKIGLCNEALYFYLVGFNNSLTTKFNESFWISEKTLFKELKQTLEFYNLDTDLCIEQQLYSILASLNNNMMQANPKGFIQRYRDGVKILNSHECKVAFSKGEFSAYHPLYVKVLKMRSYFLVLLFHKLFRLYDILKKRGEISGK